MRNSSRSHPAGDDLVSLLTIRLDGCDGIEGGSIDDHQALAPSLDADVRIDALVKDGDETAAGAELMRLEGNARAMLAAERSALNTLQHLSGIATLTRRYVEAIAGTGAILLDTRKTLPGLRVLDKYAARIGGAQNHRMRLDDGILIKDNHVAVCGGVARAVRSAKAANAGLPVQVEVDRIDQIEPALAAGADRLLLDNMAPDTLRDAVALVAGRVPLEASGGVNLDTIRAIAEISGSGPHAYAIRHPVIAYALATPSMTTRRSHDGATSTAEAAGPSRYAMTR